jgi:malonyl-CoA O-methyltransferase
MSAPIELARVRRLFARPDRMAPSDFLRREIASRMHERLELVKIAPRRVLDAGCGAGADLAVLQRDYPAAQMIGVDAAPPCWGRRASRPARWSAVKGLLSRLLPAKAGIDLLCGDFGDLPFGPNSVDLVWSNLALHWHPQPDRVFAEWRRVLRVEGLLMFSNFGPDTLRELRAAFAEVDERRTPCPLSTCTISATSWSKPVFLDAGDGHGNDHGDLRHARGAAGRRARPGRQSAGDARRGLVGRAGWAGLGRRWRRSAGPTASWP